MTQNSSKKYILIEWAKFSIYAPIDNAGKNEIVDFLDIGNARNTADKNERIAMHRRLINLANGKKMSLDICHQIDDDEKIWQIRSELHRIPWFYDKGKIIVCTHIFGKKTNGSTPEKEIKRARRKKMEYLQAKEKGNIELEE